MTEFEKIKAMSCDEMARAISKLLSSTLNKYRVLSGKPTIDLTEDEIEENNIAWKEFLESEVEENE